MSLKGMIPLFISLWVFSSQLPAQQTIKIIEQTENIIRISAQFSQPDIKTVVIDNKLYSDISLPEGTFFVQDNLYQLPFKSEMIHLAGKTAGVVVLSSKGYRIPVNPPKPCSLDKPVGTDDMDFFIVNKTVDLDNRSVTSPVELHYKGAYRGNYLWGIDLFPCTFDSRANELIVNSEIIFEIKVTGSKEKVPVGRDDLNYINNLGVLSQTKFKEKKQRPYPLAKKEQSETERWKIIIDQDGFYHISGLDLSAAGLRLRDIDFKTLKLTLDGKNVPIYVKGWNDGQFDRDDYFEFWGEYNRQSYKKTGTDLYIDPYSKSNVYWLSWGGQKGEWMGEEEGLVSETPGIQYNSPFSFHQTVHVESDVYYDRLSSVESDSIRDHWFYDGGIKAGLKEEYEFELWHPDPQSKLGVLCRLLMCGRTVTDTTSHNISAYLNKNFFVKGRWFQQNYIDLNMTNDQLITGADLTSGTNVLTIVNENDAQEFDFVMLNWFEVTYPRLYRAQDGFLKFTIPPDYDSGDFLFRIDGFEDENIEIFKLNHNKIVGGTVTETTDFKGFTSYQISFADYISSKQTEYIAVSPKAKLKALAIRPDVPTRLKSTDLAADYVIISHNRFVNTPALDELVQLRQSFGYRTLKIDVQDIFDEFNYGKPSPYAIKEFLRWAYNNWASPQLKYVLLVGDGSYVRYTSEPDTLDLVPVYMRQTYGFGAAASDYWYTLIDGDDEISDIYIGRLPARDPVQLEQMVAKIVNYETAAPSGDWRNRLLYIGGNGKEFRDQGEELALKAPPRFDVNRLFTFKDQTLKNDPFFGGTLDLLDYFNEGCAVITFHGHGGGAIWADNGLLRIEDATQIYSQGKLTFILSMTCFTGAFESPSRESLADALLFTENEGAIAVLGASGFGWVQNDYYLEKEILNYLYDHTDQTLGEIISAGKTLYYAKYKYLQTITEINQYHLLGDPATRILLPENKVPVIINNQTPFPGDTLTVSCSTPFNDGQAGFHLADSIKVDLKTQNTTITGGICSAEIPIPEDLNSGSGFIRFYGANSIGTEQVHGAVSFSLNGIVFDSTKIVHSAQDSIRFYVKISSRMNLENVWCTSLNDTLKMLAEGNDWYKSERCLKLLFPRYELNYFFFVETDNDRVYKSQNFVYQMKKGPDPAIDKNSIEFSGDTFLTLKTKILNYGDTQVNQLPVVFQLQDKDNLISLGIDTVDIAPYSFTLSQIPVSLQPGTFQFQIAIDPDSAYKDISRYNNTFSFKHKTDAFNYDPPKGIVVNQTVLDTLKIDETLSITMGPDVLPQKSVLRVKEMKKIAVLDQPDFAIVDSLKFYDIAFSNINSKTLKPFQIKFNLPESKVIYFDTSGADYDLYQFFSTSKKWIRINSVHQQNFIRANLMYPGPVAVLSTRDTQPPRVQLSIDGQPYANNKYISPEPQILINLQDLNGIDIHSDLFNVTLDGKQMENSEISLPDSLPDANQVFLKLEPTFATGQHTLTVSCADCNGNIFNSEDYIFKTTNEFEIKMLGNYPNPFIDNTLFAYVLTIPVQNISLKIYTASGRLIREIDPRELSGDPNPLSADYHEINWDCRDKDGNDIANGVYFYRLTATAEGKTKKVTGKMAKIK
ncbi:hypothetical protein JXQ31_16670 [candidate division KSB1 bacterium]|nr:hypothetical protein [candidate division KSB1 bacterium]